MNDGRWLVGLCGIRRLLLGGPRQSLTIVCGVWVALFLAVGSVSAAPIFGAPEAISELNSSERDDILAFSADGLTVYLQSRRSSPEARLFSAVRTGLLDPFGPLTEADFVNVNGSDNSGHPVVSADGRTLFHTQVVLEAVRVDRIFLATRGDLASPFGSPILVPNVNIGLTSRPHWLSEDGLRLYLSAGIPGLGFELFVATRDSVGSSFSVPTSTAFTNLNTALNETEATLSSDELNVFFASDRAGDLDLWWASRPDITSPFGSPVNLAALNTGYAERGPALTGDTLFFSSDRTGSLDFDIYRATLVPEPSSFILMAFGVVGLVGRHLRRMPESESSNCPGA